MSRSHAEIQFYFVHGKSKEFVSIENHSVHLDTYYIAKKRDFYLKNADDVALLTRIAFYIRILY